MKCFYHNDADGKCAGFWVHYRARLAPHTETIDFIEMSYEKPFPMDTILPDEQIYIVDYSIMPDEMRELLKITQDVTWIDHHKTAIERYKDFEHDIRGIRYDGIAGCMLTYCYLTHMTNGGRGEVHPFDLKMTEDAPLFTKLIADWDVWKFEFGDTTRYFITAFNCGNFDPQSPEWLKLDRVQSREGCLETYMVIEGRHMLKYRDGWAKGYLERFGFETEFEGLKCFALNLSNCSSEYFKSLPEGKYDAFIAFAFNGKEWIVSMYSTSVDVSVICKKYGGGGHKKAAGFHTKELPFVK